jgi:hypothetical protein
MRSKKGSVEYYVKAALVGARATINSIERSKHTKIKWTYQGHQRMTVVPCSASDHRAIKNAVAHVKREMREIDRAGD